MRHLMTLKHSLRSVFFSLLSVFFAVSSQASSSERARIAGHLSRTFVLFLAIFPQKLTRAASYVRLDLSLSSSNGSKSRQIEELRLTSIQLTFVLATGAHQFSDILPHSLWRRTEQCSSFFSPISMCTRHKVKPNRDIIHFRSLRT